MSPPFRNTARASRVAARIAFAVASVPAVAAAAAVAVLAALAPPPAAAEPSYADHPPRARIFAPVEAVAGEPVLIGVLVSSRWGREGIAVPTAGVDIAVTLGVTATDPAADLPATVVLAPGGSGSFPATFRTPGLWRVRVEGDGVRAAESPPIRVRKTAPEERVYWGDLHGHLHTPGAGHAGKLSADEYRRFLREGFAFARDTARLDFAAFSPHLQTAGGLAHARADGTTPWNDVCDAVAAFEEPGRFVTFPAFEWQGNAGDHVVVYPAPGPLDAPADFRALCASVLGRGALLTAHAVVLPSEFTSGAAALAGVEVTRDSHATEWLGIRAIENGYAPAFLGCSDTHGGALGAQAITGLRAPSLTREDVLAAIRGRRTWATNGERIVLDFTVDDAGPFPVARVRGVGTAPIERIEIRRNGELVHTVRDLGRGLEFDAAYEDRDAPPRGARDGARIYHTRVVQRSRNRYDSSQHDQAISSPVVLGMLAPLEEPPAAAIAETPRARELREAFEHNWGYTAGSAPPPPGATPAPAPPWRRECGTIVPGHAVARARGFAALHDGRAVVALADSVLIVDPASGAVASYPLPRPSRLDPGRAFCVADLGKRGVLVRGADAGGGWASVLDPATGAWSRPPVRVDDGTFALDPDGGIVLLQARQLSRPEGTESSWPAPVTGWLLGVSRGGEALVRTYGGNAVRIGPRGNDAGHVTGAVLAAAPDGAALLLAGLTARNAELSTGVLLSRALPDGAVEGPFRVDVRPSPATDPPLAAAFTPDGALLLLGGADEWRREVEHDWWGASVERWLPVDAAAPAAAADAAGDASR